MFRCSSLLIALLLLTSTAALSKGKATAKTPAAPEMPNDLQIIGWSKDEKRFAIRLYDLAVETNELDEPPPYCPGYINHRGKKFRGGLRIQLFGGAKAINTWNIQDAQPCTPPDAARDRLAQAKAALTEQGVDLTAIGGVAMPAQKPKPPSKSSKSRTWFTAGASAVALPSGPWAGQRIEIAYRVDHRESASANKDPSRPITSQATFKVGLRSGKGLTPLGEFPLGPTDWSAMQAGHWTPTFDRLLLSPSGKSFVVLVHMDEGSMGGGSSYSLVLGLVELPPRPETASATSAPAR
ncbi:hypothetical protein [Hyalangium minutum]|uniref:Lipoprotein n=1 Tax=Hyalangium minutum TaxID=394096 RepID=A0A085WWX3_9BACT|nr:hypothetical protein [Hyalangium minutum]KFE72186.1 hypothetical protein DB31_0447 [Hyalangium minutum]